MAKRKNQGIANRYPGVLEQVKTRALEQLRHIPWPKVAAAVGEANKWEAFSLWLRAVVDAARNIPPVVVRELDAKARGFLKTFEAKLPAALNAESPGHELWNLAHAWGTDNVLFEPQKQGWLDAVHYFSSMSLPYMKAWAHWERVDKEWQTKPPAEWPTDDQWQSDVAAVTELSNPHSVAQQVLEAVSRLPASEWTQLISRFSGLAAFSLWMELMLDVEGSGCPLVADELAKRYDGFAINHPESSSGEAVRELNSWAVQEALQVKDESVLAALSWHIQNDPAYHAVRNYAVHCHDVWSHEHPARLPCFAEWRSASDYYTS